MPAAACFVRPPVVLVEERKRRERGEGRREESASWSLPASYPSFFFFFLFPPPVDGAKNCIPRMCVSAHTEDLQMRWREVFALTFLSLSLSLSHTHTFTRTHTHLTLPHTHTHISCAERPRLAPCTMAAEGADTLQLTDWEVTHSNTLHRQGPPLGPSSPSAVAHGVLPPARCFKARSSRAGSTRSSPHATSRPLRTSAQTLALETTCALAPL